MTQTHLPACFGVDDGLWFLEICKKLPKDDPDCVAFSAPDASLTEIVTPPTGPVTPPPKSKYMFICKVWQEDAYG